MKQLTLQITSLLLVTAPLLSCGRYGSPLAPELLAPRQVTALEIVPEDSGVTFNWKAPAHDARGKELKSLDGYKVYRKTINEQKDIIDSSVQFSLVAVILDEHVKIREAKRAEARAQGKPGRRVDAPESSKKFTYKDSGLANGTSYLYKIVPYNQTDIEGDISQTILIAFSGTTSHVTKIDDGGEDRPDDETELF